MRLTKEEKEMLSGQAGHATKKSMEILVALGEIYEADRLVQVSSVQVSGVSYKNLGDAGLDFLKELADRWKSAGQDHAQPGRYGPDELAVSGY